MDKLVSTARIIDRIFRIVSVLLTIALIACAVGLGIIGAAKIFDLPTEMVGSVDGQLSFGALTLHVAEGALPVFDTMLLHMAIMLVMGIGVAIIAKLCVRTIRQVLAPMTRGEPFHSEVSGHLRKLGWLSLILGLAAQIMEAVSMLTIAAMYRLDQLLVSDRIYMVEVAPSLDLSILIVPAVFFLLAYVFKYGAELQTLSDETL